MSSEESASDDGSDSDSLYEFDVASSQSSDEHTTDAAAAESNDQTWTEEDSRRNTGAVASLNDIPEASTTDWTMSDTLGVYPSRKEARRQLDITENARFKFKHNYSTRNGTITVLKCSSHTNCHRFAKISTAGGEMETIAVTITGEHNTHASQTPRTGIHKLFEVECDNLLLGGATPARCLVVLRERYNTQHHILHQLPDALQLRNRSAVLKDNGKFDIKTMAEVNLWASPKMCTSKNQFEMRSENTSFDDFSQHDAAYKDELLVLHTFHEPLPDSEDEVSLGIVFTSRRLFRNLQLARYGHRHNGLVASTDGTYRLHHGGWTLVAFGSVGVCYDRQRYIYCHRFFPIAYLFVRAETTTAYSELFNVVKARCESFLGWKLNIQFGTLDHADAITSAYKSHWPRIELLNCWPHLSSNLTKKMALLVDRKKNESNVRSQVNYLQKSRCPGQFRALCALVVSNWIKLKEPAIAAWFKEEYLSKGWKLWYYSASRAPGVTPNQNPIEAHNRDIKRVVGPDVNAATEVVLHTTLPRLLIFFGSIRDSGAGGVSGAPIQPYCSGPISLECAQKAMILATVPNHRELKNVQRSRVLGILYNTSKLIVGNGAAQATPVNEGRATIFTASLRGSLQKLEIVENIEVHYLSLHLVRIQSDRPFTHNWDFPNWPEAEVSHRLLYNI
jgi:hypothetical protein